MTHVLLTQSKTLLTLPHYTINPSLWLHLGTPQDKQRRRGPNYFHFNVKNPLDYKTHTLEQPISPRVRIKSSQTYMYSYNKYYKSKCIKVML